MHIKKKKNKKIRRDQGLIHSTIQQRRKGMEAQHSHGFTNTTQVTRLLSNYTREYSLGTAAYITTLLVLLKLLEWATFSCFLYQ